MDISTTNSFFVIWNVLQLKVHFFHRLIVLLHFPGQNRQNRQNRRTHLCAPACLHIHPAYFFRFSASSPMSSFSFSKILEIRNLFWILYVSPENTSLNSASGSATSFIPSRSTPSVLTSTVPLNKMELPFTVE